MLKKYFPLTEGYILVKVKTTEFTIGSKKVKISREVDVFDYMPTTYYHTR